MDRLYRIFNELGIPCYLLFDYDLGSADPAVRRDSKTLLALVGRQDIVDPTAPVIEGSFSCFSQHWEADLKHEIPDWPTLKQEAKRELGLADESKPLIARYVARKLTESEGAVVPPTIKSIIERIASAGHPGTCLQRA